MHVKFKTLNEDIEEGVCAIRLYRTYDKEVFTSKESAYEYLYKKLKKK